MFEQITLHTLLNLSLADLGTILAFIGTVFYGGWWLKGFYCTNDNSEIIREIKSLKSNNKSTAETRDHKKLINLLSKHKVDHSFASLPFFIPTEIHNIGPGEAAPLPAKSSGTIFDTHDYFEVNEIESHKDKNGHVTVVQRIKKKDEPPSYYAYKYLGKSNAGIISVLKFFNGSGSGTFFDIAFFVVLEAQSFEITDEVLKTSNNYLLYSLGKYSIGDRPLDIDDKIKFDDGVLRIEGIEFFNDERKIPKNNFSLDELLNNHFQ